MKEATRVLPKSQRTISLKVMPGLRNTPTSHVGPWQLTDLCTMHALELPTLAAFLTVSVPLFYFPGWHKTNVASKFN